MVSEEKQLDLEVQHLRRNAFAPSTLSSYTTQLKSYQTFCSMLGYNVVPLPQEKLLRYVAWLARRLTPASISKYLNIVRIIHLEAGLPNPVQDNWQVQTALQGFKRLKNVTPNRKLPITPRMLLQIRSLIDLHSPFGKVFWAACLMGFFGLLRKSNLFWSNLTSKHFVRRGDLVFHKNYMILTIAATKTIQFAQRKLSIPLLALQDHPLCPVMATRQVLTLSPMLEVHEPLFSFSSPFGKMVLTYEKFLNEFKRVLSRLGYSQHEFASHSLRRGGASWALHQQLSADAIKLLGDWQSNAYQVYLLPSVEEKIKIMEKFCHDLPKM